MTEFIEEYKGYIIRKFREYNNKGRVVYIAIPKRTIGAFATSKLNVKEIIDKLKNDEK